VEFFASNSQRHDWTTLTRTMQEATVSPRVFSHDQNLARFEKSFNNPALSLQALK